MVGGRAMRGIPPGARVEQPPKKPQRGREADTFFVLVTPSGQVQGNAGFYEGLARLAGEFYFRTSSSITSGLRESIIGINSHLMSYNANSGEQYQVNLIAMVLRGHEVFIARTGATVSLLSHGETFYSSPEDLHDELALNALPLGYSPSADVKLARYEIVPGQVLVLSDNSLLTGTIEALKIALAAGANQAVQNALKSLAGASTQAMIIEFRRPEPVAKPPPTPEPLPAPPPAAEVLPDSVVSPVIEEPTKQELPEPVVAAVEATESAQPSEVSTPAPIQPKPAKIEPPKPNIAKRLTMAVAWILRAVVKVINTILDKLLPEPKEGAPNISTSAAIGIAILIPVVAIFVMVGFQLFQIDNTNFEQMVSQIQSQANEAAAIPKTDEQKAKTLWIAVLQRLEMAELQRPKDATLQKIRAQAEAALDDFGRVTRKTPVALRTFPNNAVLGAVWLQGSSDVYTLDKANSAIYRDTLRQPDQFGSARSQGALIQNGAPVSGYVVRKLNDILWVDEAGVRTSHALVGLEPQGFLITYSPAAPPAQAQALPGSERWKNPIALSIWKENLYILDPGANQIWRYKPAGTTYPNPPEEYFELEYQRNLANAVDFAIDEKGNVYVLFSTGTMKKYNAGAEQNFALNNMPEGGLHSANAMHLDGSSALQAIYITDPIDQAVYEFTLAGTFQNRYKSSDPNAFRKLSSVYVEGVNAYVTDGNVLYYFEAARK